MSISKMEELSQKIMRLCNNLEGEESILVLCSGDSQSLLCVSGREDLTINGLVNAMDQKKDFAEIILTSAKIFTQVKEDSRAVENLVKNSLGNKGFPPKGSF